MCEELPDRSLSEHDTLAQLLRYNAEVVLRTLAATPGTPRLRCRL